MRRGEEAACVDRALTVLARSDLVIDSVSVHVSNVLRKLDARDRRHAGEIGRNAGLGR